MAPKRKRTAKTAEAPAAKAAAPVSKLDAIFNKYRQEDDEPDNIGPAGVEKLCKDLGLNPADRRVLLLAWKMGAKRMGFFTRQEFTHGFNLLGATTIAALKRALPKLDNFIAAPDNFADFFAYAFHFCCTEPGQKIIDVETAAQMLSLALPDGRFVDSFVEFLLEQTSYKKLSLDQWNNFLRFSREVAADMSNASDNPAWPVLLDDFVEWYQQRQN